jgi:hypothetical protein
MRLRASRNQLYVAAWIVMAAGTAFVGAADAPKSPGPAQGAASRISTAKMAFRPPAVPLMVHNSYFSVWAFSEWLPEADILNWTRTPNPITCLVNVDGKTFRLMGDPKSPLPVLEQKSLAVHPTETTYLFANPEIEVELSFFSPVLVEDLKLLARPVSFIRWKIRSLDGKTRNVQVYLDIESQIALLDAGEKARFERVSAPGFDLLRVGSVEQPVLGYRGDVTPLDWGYCYLGLPDSEREGSGFGLVAPMREAFAEGRFKGESFNQPGPFMPCEQKAAMGVSINCGPVGAAPVERKVMVGYDSSPELQYFTKAMESYWKNETPSFVELLKNCWADYPAVSGRCADFDRRLIADATKVGGENYAQLISLLYRQVIGAHHLTRDEGGNPIYFSRENASNSSVSTVDVSFPSSPFFLFHSTDLLKALLVPILDYASNPEWQHDSSPHSIGTFPHATGQRYGGKGSPMPVEESGNMLLMIAGICQVEGNPSFAVRYRGLLDKWAAHLAKNGYDTGEQLCTDDFRGRQLHNTNLSVKGICGLAAYAKVLEMMGDKEKAAQYTQQAKVWAQQWEKEALSPDGTHFVQAFGKPETWSFKYNMVWDKLLGLGLFSPETFRKEFAFYQTKMEKYGVPMDHINKQTKFDWHVWVACFADKPEDRALLLNPLYKMVNESPTRLPLTDYFNTDTGTIAQFYARSVMGGVWLPLALEHATLAKWAAQNPSKLREWSPQPPHPDFANLIRAKDAQWKYAFDAPGKDWEKPAFDDTAWASDVLPLGNRAGRNGSKGETPWPKDKQEVWLRKSFPKPALSGGRIQILATYQDDFEVFLNGRKIFGNELNGANLSPNGALSNSPGQVCEADAALGNRNKNASSPEKAPSQNRPKLAPFGTDADSRANLPFSRIQRIIPVAVAASDFSHENVIAIHSKCARKNPALDFDLEEVSSKQ